MSISEIESPFIIALIIAFLLWMLAGAALSSPLVMLSGAVLCVACAVWFVLRLA